VVQRFFTAKSTEETNKSEILFALEHRFALF